MDNYNTLSNKKYKTELTNLYVIRKKSKLRQGIILYLLAWQKNNQNDG